MLTTTFDHSQILDPNDPARAQSAETGADSRLMAKRWASVLKGSMHRPSMLPEDMVLAPSRYTMTVALKGSSILLFNAVTRALSRLDGEEAARWTGWEAAGNAPVRDDANLARMLAGDGFLVPRDRREFDAVRLAYLKARSDRHQLSLTIAPTMACNLACGYCFQGQNKDLQKLDPRVPDAIMGFVEERENLKSLNVTWYGGEPLMAKGEIYALADRFIAHCDAGAMAYSSTIVTNGYFLTVEVARQLVARRCTMAQVTVDGVGETHDKMRPLTSGRGSFEAIMENLKAVVEETQLAISLRVNVSRRNVLDCNALLDDLERRGFAGRPTFIAYFAPVDAGTPESGTAFEEGLSRQAYNEAVLKLGRRAREMKLAGPIDTPKGFMGMCVAAQLNGFVITHRGDVHKCWETAHDPRKRIGTLFDKVALEGSLNAMLWRAWSPFDNEVCSSCKILPMCGGLCAHRFIYAGIGDENALPCPEWKWSTAEYLFARAKDMGAVTDDDWLEGQSTATAMQSGRRHSKDSLMKAASVVLKKVGMARGEAVGADYLRHGDGRMFEMSTVSKS